MIKDIYKGQNSICDWTDIDGTVFIKHKNIRPILKVSNSDMATFKRCLRKWNLSSFNRRNLTGKLPSAALWIGTGGHYALEHWEFYGGTKNILEAFEEYVQREFAQMRAEFDSSIIEGVIKDLNTVVELGRKVLKQYAEHAMRHDNFKFVAREYEFAVPIPGVRIAVALYGKTTEWAINLWGVDFTKHPDFIKTYINTGLYDEVTETIPPLFVGRLDGIVQMNDEPQIFNIIDHKFLARALSEDSLLLDEQTAKYIWAAHQAIDAGMWDCIPQGARVRGCFYNMIIKKEIRKPKQNKDGSTSRAAVSTTPDIFRATLLERNEDPLDYVEQIAKLDVENFFKRYRVFRGPSEIAATEARLVAEYLAMAQVNFEDKDIANPHLYPSPTKDCPWECSMRHACYAVNSGNDAEYYLEQDMRVSSRTYYDLDNDPPPVVVDE